MIAPEDEDLTIKSGGKIVGGWETIRVTRGVERLPSDCVVELTERYPGQADASVLTPGDDCEVWLGADKIMSGIIDRYSPSIDEDEHKVSVSIRSYCRDIVDCSVALSIGWSLNVGTLSQAANIICAPFGITVKMPDGDAQLSPDKPFSINPGDTAYTVLEQVARSVAMLVWDDADGNLVLSKVGDEKTDTALVLGEQGNVKRASSVNAIDQRYSDYIVLVQASQPVTQAAPTGFANLIGVEHDPDIKRYRPHVILMEYDSPDHSIAEQRGRWEASRRYGRGLQVNLVVTGWRDGAGKLWMPNTRAAVSMPALKVDEGELVIAEATWQRSERGTETVLTLMRAEGLEPEPLVINPLVPGTQLGAPHDGGQNQTGGSSLSPGQPPAAPSSSKTPVGFPSTSSA